MNGHARAWLLASALPAGAGLALGTERKAELSSVDSSTLEMSRLLQERAAKVDAAKLTFVVNDRRAELFAEALTWPRPIVERLRLRFRYASELLSSGRIGDSLQELDRLQEDAGTNAPHWWSANRTEAQILRAMAYLRMAEEQNCHQGNTRDSCLLPLRGTGLHQRREGSTRAIEVLNAILAADPTHLRARWLLNVAHMTLGSHPDGVAPGLLIPATAFASEHPLPRFVNVAREAGLDLYGLSGGAIADDFDNDGRLDLMVSGIGFEEQLRYFRNRGTAGSGSGRPPPASPGRWEGST